MKRYGPLCPPNQRFYHGFKRVARRSWPLRHPGRGWCGRRPQRMGGISALETRLPARLPYEQSYRFDSKGGIVWKRSASLATAAFPSVSPSIWVKATPTEMPASTAWWSVAAFDSAEAGPHV
jgi:hypothetical protein